MTRNTRLKINIVLIILIFALTLLAVAGICLNIAGYRYYKADNGSKFIGKTTDGIILRGTIILADGSRATIDRTLGTIEYDNGDKYDGEFSGFYRSGKGIMTYASTGDVYEGTFAADKISGTGVYRCADGSYYEGEFVDGKKSGQGKYTWSDGSYYEGGFLDNRKSGSGKYVGADGSSYVGEYLNDRKNGTGTFVYANGDKYTGEFVDDRREGTGTYIWANGESYTGEFKNNMKHGKGIYKWPEPNARSYEGYFENGAVVIEDEEDADAAEDSEPDTGGEE
jgi:hypothetical protein